MPTRVLTPRYENGVMVDIKVTAPPSPPLAHGLTPTMLDRANHLQRTLLQLRSKDKNLEKYIFLSQLKQTDEELFFKLLLDHMPEITPLIYTPTVGDACLEFSHIFRRPEGLYISYHDKGKIGSVLRNWPRKEEARIAVVTDGSRILGLGDLGINGMPISIGKLSLYIAGAGLRPASTLPICLDLGTNNEKNLQDPLYLGLRQRRVSDSEMQSFMEEFMTEMHRYFPKLLVQFEDFSTDNAFKYLDMFRHNYQVFNDDIQGTGGVVLSGFMNAAKLSSAASGLPLKDHKVLFLGAGSAGVGVAKQLTSFFMLQGLSEEEAKRRIWTVDSQGLITANRPSLAEHKKYFARTDYSGPPLKQLIDIIQYVKPTALLGLSTIRGAFTREVITAMAGINPRPIIFPLSNPVKLSECEFHEAIEWTNGSAIFASGSPFPSVEYGGYKFEPGQGNNMYIFPGLGLGAILARSTVVTDSMVLAASLALSESLNQQEKDDGLIYPRLTRIRDISEQIACRVIREAQKEGVDSNIALKGLDDDALRSWVREKMWRP
jgi:malate dehydrogenase (oxaloacetate-decarboxylating)(NADP+)